MNFDFSTSFNFNFGKKERVITDFVTFCERAGYPKPFNKQIEMKDFVINGEGIRMLLGARRYGKTDYCTILGTAEKLMLNPNYRILIITKEQSRGTDIVAEVREILAKNGCKFQTNARKVVRMRGLMGKEPNLAALTVRSKGVRGRHPDLVIMEDPITPDDTGEAERLRVKKMFDEIVKLTHNIAIIGQPAHKLDLFQTLRKVIPTKLVPFGSIPELDADLDAERAAGVDEYSIQASYFLEILDDGSLPFSKIKTVDYYAKDNITWVDPSHKGKDYTAIVAGGRNLNDFVLTGFCFKKAWYDCIEEMQVIHKKFNNYHFVIETNGIGELPIRELHKIGCPCQGFNTTMEKHKKILNASTFVNDLKLAIVKDMPANFLQANKIFIDQVKNYEYSSKYDDAPDAAASLIAYVRGL